jgi:hypothetical protein
MDKDHGQKSKRGNSIVIREKYCVLKCYYAAMIMNILF